METQYWECWQQPEEIPYKLLLNLPTTELMPHIPCKVCRDESSGIHYGVISCEGCKGFFRRNYKKFPFPRCMKGHSFNPMTKHNRNRCPECRLTICLQVGMKSTYSSSGRMSSDRKIQVINEVLRENYQILPKLIEKARSYQA